MVVSTNKLHFSMRYSSTCHAALYLSLLLFFACKPSSGPRMTPLAKGATVLAFGDSLTFGTGAASGQDYPTKLRQLSNLQVIGSGVPGEGSAAGVVRLKAVLAKERPALLILLHGGNDFLRHQNTADTKKNVRSMIELARSQGMQVLLIGVPQPTIGFSHEAASLYAELASELAVPYEAQTLTDLLYDDHFKSDAVHLNAEGYGRLAQAIYRLLEESGAIAKR